MGGDPDCRSCQKCGVHEMWVPFCPHQAKLDGVVLPVTGDGRLHPDEAEMGRVLKMAARAPHSPTEEAQS